MFTLDIYMTHTEVIMQKHDMIFGLIYNEYLPYLLENWNFFNITDVTWSIKDKYPNANIPQVTYKTLFGPIHRNEELSRDLTNLLILTRKVLTKIEDLLHLEYRLEENKHLGGIKRLTMDNIEQVKNQIRYILKDYNKLYKKLKQKYPIVSPSAATTGIF